MFELLMLLGFFYIGFSQLLPNRIVFTRHRPKTYVGADTKEPRGPYPLRASAKGR